MKKRLGVICLCFFLLFGAGTVQAKTDTIENIATVVGSYCYDGFVPHSAVLFKGDIVVADKDNHRLSIIDRTSSRVVKTIGTYGEETGQFRFPRDLAVHGKELFVCDSLNKRISILSEALEVSRHIDLKESPKQITVYKDKLYVLYESGLKIDVFNGASKTFERSIVLNKKAEDFGVFGEKIVIIGTESYLLNMKDNSYERANFLDGCAFVESSEEGLYVLFDDSLRVLDEYMNKIRSYPTKQGSSSVYPGAGSVIVASTEQGKVYEYKDSSLISTYGRGQTLSVVDKVAVKGRMSAVSAGKTIEFYKDGKAVASLDYESPVDMKIIGSQLFVLGSTHLKSYNIDSANDAVSITPDKTLEANGAYSFTSMDSDGSNIYISEVNSGRILKTTTELKVFSAAIGQLNSPKSVAYGDGRLYVAQDGFLGMYGLGGDKLGQAEGTYAAISYKDGLYAIGEGGKEISRFNSKLEKDKPVAYEGYFLNLKDVEATGYGVFVTDGDRKELMVYTNEDLELTSGNVSIDSRSFNGTVQKGETITVNVSGAGMINPLPSIGDVRYSPDSAFIDTEVGFTEDKGRYTASINLPNVGNYTLKVAYKKQVFIGGKWQDLSTGDSAPVYDLPITVAAQGEVQRDEQARVICSVLNELRNFLFGR